MLVWSCIFAKILMYLLLGLQLWQLKEVIAGNCGANHLRSPCFCHSDELSLAFQIQSDLAHPGQTEKLSTAMQELCYICWCVEVSDCSHWQRLGISWRRRIPVKSPGGNQPKDRNQKPALESNFSSEHTTALQKMYVIIVWSNSKHSFCELKKMM